MMWKFIILSMNLLPDIGDYISMAGGCGLVVTGGCGGNHGGKNRS